MATILSGISPIGLSGILAQVLTRLARLIATLETLLTAIDFGIALDALLLTFGTLRLALDALLLTLDLALLALLTLDALRTIDPSTFLPLNLTLLPLDTLWALDTLGPFRPLDLLPLGALRAFGTLYLLPFRTLGTFSLLRLLTLGALRAFSALDLLSAAAARLSLLLRLCLLLFVLITTTIRLLGERGDGKGHAGNTGKHDHLAGHNRPPMLGFTQSKQRITLPCGPCAQGEPNRIPSRPVPFAPLPNDAFIRGSGRASFLAPSR